MSIEDRGEARRDDAERLLADAARAAGLARARREGSTADLFLTEAFRLTDADRTTMARLLAGLIGVVEDDLRRLLIERLTDRVDSALLAALGSDRITIAAPVLARAGLLRDPDLVALLLRRSTEHRLTLALRTAAERAAGIDPDPPASVSDRLIRHSDPAIAGEAMALLLAESRRFDRFAEPILARTDLPAEVQHRLVWVTSAALRPYLIEAHSLDPALADHALADAATALLAGYDESATLEVRAMTLARTLHHADLLDDGVIARILADARVSLAVAAVAVRAGIRFDAAWDMLTDREAARRLILLNAIAMARPHAIDIALRFALALDPADGGEQLADAIEGYDALDPARALGAIVAWRADPAYVRACADIDAGLAPRGALL